jgi:formylglycine-generating enzyme required for sulfatase activity
MHFTPWRPVRRPSTPGYSPSFAPGAARSILAAALVALAAARGFGQTAADAASSADDAQMTRLSAAGDSFVMGDGLLGPNVTLSFTRDFLMGRFLVTNRRFQEFIDAGGYDDQALWTAQGWSWKGKISRPAYWGARGFADPAQPVVGVSWYECAAFCNWLSRQEGLDPAYGADGRADTAASGYRLPTEAEWEYAAAKGGPDQAERIYPWGTAWDPANAVCAVTPPRAKTTAAVGSRSPRGDTPQGLADMSGNAWEWCSDNAQRDDAVTSVPGADRYWFQGDAPSAFMILRGGAWCNDFPNGFRASFRGFTTRPGNRANSIGFRVVRGAAPEAAREDAGGSPGE